MEREARFESATLTLARSYFTAELFPLSQILKESWGGLNQRLSGFGFLARPVNNGGHDQEVFKLKYLYRSTFLSYTTWSDTKDEEQ